MVGSELVVQHSAPPARLLNPMDIDPEDFRSALTRRSTNRNVLLEWVLNNLKEGVDYGRIHVVKKSSCSNPNCTYDVNPRHWSKPNLFKPGAEKIAGMLGITPDFPALVDYERAAIEGREIKSIVLRCNMLDASDRIIGQGIGARSVLDDYGDLNKALKMAKKSAHVDATLSTGGLSEIFTQGLEDLPAARLDEMGTTHEEVAHPPTPTTYQEAPRAPRPQSPQQSRPSYPVTPGQVNLLRVRLDRAGVAESDFLAHFAVGSVEEFPKNRVDEALEWLKKIAP
jgi:hypothetical protein